MISTTPQYTPQQAAAIAAREVSVALSAGAGCGKTFVLTERFLAHLDPEDPHSPRPAELGELIAITFTDRAAREMRDRIRQKCYERLERAGGQQAPYWLELLRAIDRARVSTIHSFCSSLLRRHAVEAGLDPGFSLMEEAQAGALKREAVDDFLRSQLIYRSETALALAAEFGLEQVRGFLWQLLSPAAEPGAERWLENTPAEQVALWQRFHRLVVVPAVLERLLRFEDGRKLAELFSSRSFTNPTLRDRARLILDRLPALREKLDEFRRETQSLPVADQGAANGESEDGSSPQQHAAREHLQERLSNHVTEMESILDDLREGSMVQGAGGAKSWESKEAYESYRDLAKAFRGDIDKAKAQLTFDPQEAEASAAKGLQLWQLACDAGEQYQKRKRELSLLDFDDLLSLARQLLSDPRHASVRHALARETRLLLVDEFQDTDPGQVELVRALCNDAITGGKLFFVGDFKQSIYRFRGADPGVFRRLQEEMPAAGRLPLTQNFRSQPGILNFVNALFEAQFDPYEPLRPSRPQVTRPDCVEMMWVPCGDLEQEAGLKDQLRRKEADWIARRIRALLESGEPLVWDQTAAQSGAPAARPAECGDIALLFRALSDVQYYEEALRSYGIDYYLVGGHAFYAQQEIFDLLNLLRSLVSPCDEVSLAGALRSPFFSLPDEALFWLSRENGLAAGFFDERLPSQLKGTVRRRAENARQTLLELRAAKDRLPVAGLINLALEKTGYDAAMLAEFLGRRKLANLHKLIEEARSFDRAGIFGLHEYIVQLSQFVARQPREALAATHPEATNVVRLMTIHQSKGLEFPIVVIPDIDRPSYNQVAGAACTDLLGPVVRPGVSGTPCGHRLWETVEKLESELETTRLLYVACTRAGDYLILSGGIEDPAEPKGPWTKTLHERFDLETGALREVQDAGPGASRIDPANRPRVRIIGSRPETNQKQAARTQRASIARMLQRSMELAKKQQGRIPPAAGPIAVDRSARRNWSFSQLSGDLKPVERLEPDPAGEEARLASLIGRLDATLLGSLTHAVLERVNFAGENDLERIIRRVAPAWTDDEAIAAEALHLVRDFMASPLVTELGQAAKLHRELEFLLAWPPGSETNNGLFLEGFIDCLYQTPGGDWVVLDYKTNNVTAAQVPQAALAYETQLGVYALAAEAVLNVAPARLTLSFLRPGESFTWAWDEASRRRTIELVTEALAASMR